MILLFLLSDVGFRTVPYIESHSFLFSKRVVVHVVAMLLIVDLTRCFATELTYILHIFHTFHTLCTQSEMCLETDQDHNVTLPALLPEL